MRFSGRGGSRAPGSKNNSGDINSKWEACSACHQSISALTADMFALFRVCFSRPQQVTAASNPVLSSKPTSTFSIPPFYPITAILVLDLGVGGGGGGGLNEPSHSIELLLESCGLSDCLGRQMKASPSP